MTTPDNLTPILKAILKDAEDLLKDDGRPVGHVSYQPGNTVSWDDCEDCRQGGQLWVRLISLVPQPAGGSQPCGPLANQVRAALGVVRCVHGVTDEGFPSPEELTGDATQITEDAFSLQNALVNYDWPSQFVGVKTVNIESGLPLGPQGFCAGFEWTFAFKMLR